MQKDKTAIRTYFSKLGLESEIADLYLALYEHGPQTISALSRNSGVERTRIYRLINRLMDSNLVEVETHYKRGIIKPAPVANLQILISKREQELKALQDELPLVEQALARNSLSSPATRVQFYQGLEGTKQMIWNETKGKGENLSILAENMQTRTKDRFFERWASKCNVTGLQFRSVFGDDFIASQKHWYSHHKNTKLQRWQGRHISSSLFPINHNTVIYDDVVAYYNWKDGEIFGIEIHNSQIADSQRQFFEMLWQQATPYQST